MSLSLSLSLQVQAGLPPHRQPPPRQRLRRSQEEAAAPGLVQRVGPALLRSPSPGDRPGPRHPLPVQRAGPERGRGRALQPAGLRAHPGWVVFLWVQIHIPLSLDTSSSGRWGLVTGALLDGIGWLLVRFPSASSLSAEVSLSKTPNTTYSFIKSNVKVNQCSVYIHIK